MGRPFQDITLYGTSPFGNDTPQYWEQVSLQNFVCDLYVTKMSGYKPPKASRVTIEPSYYGIWDRTWKFGSIISIAVEFRYDKYEKMDKQEQYKYILDVIQSAMLLLSEEYNWERTVFEKAYREVLGSNFIFKIDYPPKMSKDRKKEAYISIEKTETVTSCYAVIQVNGLWSRVKLFDTRNWGCYDPVYKLVKYAKWYDTERFGLYHAESALEIWYSIQENKVAYYQSGTQYQEVGSEPFLHLRKPV